MSIARLIVVEAALIAAAAVVGVLLARLVCVSSSASTLGITVRQVVPAETQACELAAGGEPLVDSQILSYYGNPYAKDMGILGEMPLGALLDKLESHAQRYNSLNGSRTVQTALHLVYATAQRKAGPDGLHLTYVGEETLQEYLDIACENGLLVFLDLQIGRSDVQTELAKVAAYLEHPHVHVALDPEYAVAEGEIPRETLGSLDAADVNAAQALLQGYLEEHDLPDKILIVHQFTPDMLTQPELIEDYPRVKFVIDMDGIGPPHLKQVVYRRLTAPAEYAGIKLFFRLDQPTHLMSEQQVLELKPDVIIYQ